MHICLYLSSLNLIFPFYHFANCLFAFWSFAPDLMTFVRFTVMTVAANVVLHIHSHTYVHTYALAQRCSCYCSFCPMSHEISFVLVSHEPFQPSTTPPLALLQVCYDFIAWIRRKQLKYTYLFMYVCMILHMYMYMCVYICRCWLFVVGTCYTLIVVVAPEMLRSYTYPLTFICIYVHLLIYSYVCVYVCSSSRSQWLQHA